MTRLQVQEQADDSFSAPPDYEGRIELDPILLDADRLVVALETGVFELRNTRVHQNLLLVMDMVIFRTIFFELLVFFTFTLLTFHFAY